MGGTPDLQAGIAAIASDGAGGGGRFQQRRQHDLVGIGEAGFLATRRPDADTLLDGMAGVLDLPVLQPPGFGAALLKIQVAAVDGVAQQTSQGSMQGILAETGGREQLLAGKGQRIGRHHFLKFRSAHDVLGPGIAAERSPTAPDRIRPTPRPVHAASGQGSRPTGR